MARLSGRYHDGTVGRSAVLREQERVDSQGLVATNPRISSPDSTTVFATQVPHRRACLTIHRFALPPSMSVEPQSSTCPPSLPRRSICIHHYRAPPARPGQSMYPKRRGTKRNEAPFARMQVSETHRQDAAAYVRRDVFQDRRGRAPLLSSKPSQLTVPSRRTILADDLQNWSDHASPGQYALHARIRQ